jgi:hypothetical protein
MKKSHIQKIIREEFVNILREQTLVTEAFQDPIARMLSKDRSLGNGWFKFFNAMSNSFDIAWDQVPKGAFQRVAPGSPLTKKGLAIYYIEGNKENPFATTDRYGYSGNKTLRGPAVLAATINNKITYGGGRGEDARVGGKSRRTEPVGKNVRGTMQVNKLKDIADVVYVFDLDSYRGGTTALKSARASLKLGKDKFTDHKAWKKANLRRYEDILRSRVGTRDQVDRMVAEIVKIANQAVTDAVGGVVKQGKYGDIQTTINGQEVALEDVTTSMSNALKDYKRYIDYENEEDQAAKAGGNSYGGNYYGEKKKEYALQLKRYLKGFKTGKIKRY